MSKLQGKVVVVTGGAEGIGYAIADQYLENGAKTVIILDINEAKGAEAVKTLTSKYKSRAVFLKCDVTKDLEAVFSKIVSAYKVDVLVNNAGVLDENNISKTIGVNVIALMEWSMKFWEYMRKDKGGNGGTILNIASIAGFLIDPFMIYYKTSKVAIMAFTRSLGHEFNYRKTGVQVVALCPGLTNTTLITHQLVWDEHLEDFHRIFGGFPWQQPEDVGRAAVDIIGKAPSGTAWVVNGGTPIYEAPECVKLTMENMKRPETINL